MVLPQRNIIQMVVLKCIGVTDMAKKNENKGFKNFLEGICKSIYGCYKTCDTCQGTGKVKRYPYYATVMPEMVEMTCEDCGGHGRFFVVPDRIRLIRKSDVK
jgi:DnaJ-class molecular chaperone